jgi:uracil-DNA glycosylase
MNNLPMDTTLEASWKKALKHEWEQVYLSNLLAFVDKEYATKVCYPPRESVFAAMNCTQVNDVKVVILGQDPYHGAGQGNGFAFSVNEGIKKPPSLVNVFKEIEQDLGISPPESGNLERWANQGVLLLNAVLTVQESKAGSHKNKGWERFTDAAIKMTSVEREHVVFMLWGGFAKGKIKLIDSNKHLILESGHPSPLSANRGHWFGNRHFSQANAYLVQNGYAPINW